MRRRTGLLAGQGKYGVQETGANRTMNNNDDQTFSYIREENYFACCLPQGKSLNATGYKVMRNLVPAGLVAAYPSRLNGRVRLLYDISRYNPLSALASQLTPSQFTQIAKNLLELLEKIRANGFLRLENVLLDTEYLMIDESMGAHLIYLPVDEPEAVTVRLTQPEMDVKRFLAQFIKETPNIHSERIIRLGALLADPARTLEDAVRLMEGAAPRKGGTLLTVQAPTLRLVKVGGNREYVFDVPVQGCVIGRNPMMSNVVLTNSAVSGSHCEIHAAEGKWFIEDLGSRNGTRVNGQTIEPHTRVPLHKGDTIEIIHYLFNVEA